MEKKKTFIIILRPMKTAKEILKEGSADRDGILLRSHPKGKRKLIYQPEKRLRGRNSPLLSCQCGKKERATGSV